jgi:hypothetical protein
MRTAAEQAEYERVWYAIYAAAFARLMCDLGEDNWWDHRAVDRCADLATTIANHGSKRAQ